MKNRLCCACKKNESGKPENISFIYDGFKITIFKDGLRCTDCAEKEWIEKNKDYWEKIIEPSKEKIPKVNWQEYLSVLYQDESKEWILGKFLLTIGVLSTSSKGGWVILGEGMNINPGLFGTPLFFVNESDVREFARLKYKDVLYGWKIQHIDKVISRGDIFQEKTKNNSS